MTKLTQEQIEKEIELFREWYRSALLEPKLCEYSLPITVWLARAELSNIEEGQ